MKTLKECIAQAEKDGIALGHFNFANIEVFNAIVESAKELNLPIVLGLSEGERDFFGISNAVALVREAREDLGIPIFLNADHTYSFERVREVIDAGFDSVIFDGVKLSLEENIKLTKQCVEYARDVSAQTGREILVEAELGYIGTSSKILEEIPEGAGETKTDPEEAKRLVTETEIDLLAPSVGNIHGLVVGGNPKLDIERIKTLREASGVPLVLHGGSGISDEDFREGIRAGISMIHINTEIRKVYRESLEKSLQTSEEIAPYKYLEPARKAVKELVLAKLKLFSGLV